MPLPYTVDPFQKNTCPENNYSEWNPINGLKISIPTRDEKNPSITTKNLDFNFIFIFDSTIPPRYDLKITNESCCEIKLFNFGNALPTGTVKPIGVKYSNVTISIFLIAQSIENPVEGKILNMTVSFFLGDF